MAKTIVILGAGMAAMTTLRQLMKNVVLPSSEYKAILVAPDTHFHWPIAMPRAIVPGQIPTDKVLSPLSARFKDYPASKFEHVIGKASNLDPDGQTVAVELVSGGTKSVSYDYLVIATGTSAKHGMPWKVVETAEKTKAIIDKLRADISTADKIVVAGGGPTGAEIAGELGFEYSKSGAKEVYYVYSGEYPLPADMLQSVRKTVKSTLEDLKVKLIPNTTITNVTRTEGGDTVLELTGKDGNVKSLTAQVYLPAIGLIPNSAFVPQRLLNASGYIKQESTLQAEGYGNIFVIGDVGSVEEGKAVNADKQALHLVKALEEILVHQKAAPEYKLNTMNGLGVTLGRSKATGQMNGWKLPSIMIWFVKGRTLLTERVDTIFV